MGAIDKFISYGVYDGSKPPPGFVGELLYIGNAIPGQPWTPVNFSTNGVLVQLGVLNLGPGDWMVGAQVDAWLSGSLNDWSSVWLGLGPRMLTIDDFNSTDVSVDTAYYTQNIPANIGDQICSPIGPININSATPIQAGFAIVWYCSQVLTGQADYVIWARRVR